MFDCGTCVLQHASLRRANASRPMGADDFFPIHIFVVVQVRRPSRACGRRLLLPWMACMGGRRRHLLLLHLSASLRAAAGACVCLPACLPVLVCVYLTSPILQTRFCVGQAALHAPLVLRAFMSAMCDPIRLQGEGGCARAAPRRVPSRARRGLTSNGVPCVVYVCACVDVLVAPGTT